MKLAKPVENLGPFILHLMPPSGILRKQQGITGQHRETAKFLWNEVAIRNQDRLIPTAITWIGFCTQKFPEII